MTPYQIPRNSLAWMLAAQAAVILPHLFRIPPWVLMIAAACIFWRVMVFQGRWSYPGRWVKVLFVLTGFAAVPYSYGQIYGVEPAVSLLVVAFSLKLLEMVQKRDAYVVIMLAYFVCITEFLFEQSIPYTLYMFTCVLLITAALIGLNQTQSHLRPLRTLKTSAVLLVQAVPLMIVLFVLFPRISPLWSVPLPNDQAKTGVTDQLSPGDIAALTESDELVFRAAFQGNAPRFSQLYWRGLVLGEFDGKTWRQDEPRLRRSPYRFRQMSPSWPEKLDYQGNTFDYEIIMEPNYQNWLFTLMLPEVPKDRDYVLLRDGQVAAIQTIRQKQRLTLRSHLDYAMYQELEPWDRRNHVVLPDEGNPRARTLAVQMRNASASPEDYANNVMRMFGREDFSYTLSPGVLETDDTVDEFLFDTQRGFCEHYASAFTFMMRAAGVPARVVVGYQGGEYNASSNFVSVRQFDAHAWSEIWLEGQGWVRRDPTAVVSPERIENGLEAAIDEAEEFLSSSPLSLLRYRQLLWLTDLRLQIESIGHYWDTFVVGYTPEMQTSILSQYLGDVSRQRLGIIMLGVFFGVLFVIALVILARRSVDPHSPMDTQYLRFCLAMAKRGVKRERGEGPLTYQQRLIEHSPDLEDEIRAVTDAYIASNFLERPEQVGPLKKAVRSVWFRSITAP
jgi:transglutaminase-like putative cysteine protease